MALHGWESRRGQRPRLSTKFREDQRRRLGNAHGAVEFSAALDEQPLGAGGWRRMRPEFGWGGGHKMDRPLQSSQEEAGPRDAEPSSVCIGALESAARRTLICRRLLHGRLWGIGESRPVLASLHPEARTSLCHPYLLRPPANSSCGCAKLGYLPQHCKLSQRFRESPP